MAETGQREKRIGRLQLFGAALLWGLAGVCVKSVTWSPMPIVAVRSIVSLLLIFAVKGDLRLKVTKPNLLGALMISATSVLYIFAIKLTTAGTAIVLQYMAPILVFLFCVVFRHRKARPAEVLLTLAVFLGCVLSFLDNLDFSHVLGNVLAFGSAFSFAGQILVMHGENCDTQDCMILGNLICFLISVPFCFGAVLDWSPHNLLWLGILAVFQYAIPNLLFSAGIKKTDSVEASLLMSIEPVFNPIPVAIFCGEKMSALAICGAALVIVSVTLYNVLPHADSETA
ncbi:MAG: DMT family transporter [Lachnospiraceae bacterium]|nr:DMT family transporter [Lachnospiraceae bacterium]